MEREKSTEVILKGDTPFGEGGSTTKTSPPSSSSSIPKSSTRVDPPPPPPRPSSGSGVDWDEVVRYGHYMKATRGTGVCRRCHRSEDVIPIVVKEEDDSCVAFWCTSCEPGSEVPRDSKEAYKKKLKEMNKKKKKKDYDDDGIPEHARVRPFWSSTVPWSAVPRHP